MQRTGWRAIALIALVSVGLLSACTGSGDPINVNIDAIAFETTDVPDAGAGEFYDVVIAFTTTGNAALPDRFELLTGELPVGLTLAADREDNDNDGRPDPDGALTGNARLIGFPRIARPALPYNFTIKAISTGALGDTPNGDLPALAAEQPYSIVVDDGSVNILNPTAQEGSSDPAVPAFPDVVDFVNPANPQAFFSFAFQTAGGTQNKILSVYMPRELELSVFDANKTDNEEDTDEGPTSGDTFKVDFADGGVFNLQAGSAKVQIGGFQSPRGVVGKITSLRPEWFQRTSGSGGPAQNSRRDFLDTAGIGNADGTLGTQSPVMFSDYFDGQYEGTWEDFSDPVLTRRKYPFDAGQYTNAFFQPFDDQVHLTPLRYTIIVEAIDTRGTPIKLDDVIARKGFVMQVRIPDIVVDTVFLNPGTAGVDFLEFVNGSGGVPPLVYELEWIDGDTSDSEITQGHPLTKSTFGVGLGESTGGFYGVPRASGNVDVSIRISATVMNPTQNGSAFVPTGGQNPGGQANEWNGTHPVTGEKGIHKTFQVPFAAPSAPSLLNPNLPSGVDGVAYKAPGGAGVQLQGTGGVPWLIPDPTTFIGDYPNSPSRTYELNSNYDQDDSYTPPVAGVVGLPNALTMVGDKTLTTSGQVSGTPFDRGFHPVRVNQQDVYLGDAIMPSDANNQTTTTNTGLDISPDTALYLRGVGNANSSGLLEFGDQISEARMVPAFFEVGLFEVETGTTPVQNAEFPSAVDIFPVAIPNGSSAAQIDKSRPSVAGFWPAEAGKETKWGDRGNAAWRHSQQEFTWLQMNDAAHTRVYLWGETQVKKWNPSVGNGVYYHGRRYQIHVSDGERGILVVNPGTGEFWMPARLTNNNANHGTGFGGEFVRSRQSFNVNDGGSYANYWYYATVQYEKMELHNAGLGAYLENCSTLRSTSQGWYANSMGRSATSVAVSADGLWCATAMPGGNSPKILLWRTDGQAVDADDNILGGGTDITTITGKASDGTDMPKSAAIINVGSASSNADDLLPDSLMFVDGGLVFLRYTNDSGATSLDTVFGFNLRDGSLSEMDMNTAVAFNSAGTLPGGVQSSRGVYVPDQDQTFGNVVVSSTAAQFAWTGNEPAAGAHGPTALAFAAGDMKYMSKYNTSSTFGREGFSQMGNAAKALMFLQVNSDATTDGLDLGNSTLTDLTGDDTSIHGDLLTPGRVGEGLDFMKVSGDGRFVAVVRDWSVDREQSSFTFGGTSRTTFLAEASYGGGTSSVNTTWTYKGVPSDDLLVISTPIASATGLDMDSGLGGTQHVLFVGQNSIRSGGASPVMPTYASSRNLVNASYRRISGLTFSKDNNSLFFDYASDSTYSVKYFGGSNSWGFNPQGGSSTFYNRLGSQMAVQFKFRNATGGAISMAATASTLATNAMAGLTGVSNTGPSTAPFGSTLASSQGFWAKFRSPNGSFLYYVCDNIDGAAHMWGINISDANVTAPDGTVREPYKAFAAHGAGVQFEQFEVKGFQYPNRFKSVPGGVTLPTTARDGSGIIFVIASDSSAGNSGHTDLEVYALDANSGGECVVLTSDVTGDVTTNAINYLYASMDGNVLVGQRSNGTNSRDTRTALTTASDLFAVTNVHAVLGGAAPDAFIVSKGRSHGASVAFVGEGTALGAKGMVYSATDGTGNTTWDERNLLVASLVADAFATTLDSTASHYAVVAASRKLDDSPTDPN